jgi:type IV pilus assembly protein PilA
MGGLFMNKSGFTLIELIVFVIIIGVIGFIAVPTFTDFTSRGKLTTFIAYEDSMQDAAKNAVIDCIGNNSDRCNLPNKGDTLNISLKTLIDEGFIDDLKNPNGGSCDLENSYVTVVNRGNLNYKFKVCLVCEGYENNNANCK